MATTGLEVFDRTLHITHQWLDEICSEIGPDRHRAWHVLGAVLRAIRDELLIGQSAHLGAQLPLLIRGAYFDQYRPAAQPAAERSQEDFIARVRDELAGSRPVRPDLAATAVMRTLNRHVAEGQIKKVRDALPKSVRALWPEPGQTATAPARAKQPAPGAAGPSQRDAAEGSREPVERELERTGAAAGVSSIPHGAPRLPGESGGRVDVDTAAERAAERGPDRGTKARRKAK